VSQQISMFADHRPPQVDGITIHLGDVHLAIDAASGCSMVIADPPWQYDNAGCRGNAADEYALDSFDQITHVLTASYSAAAANAYLLLWATWPLHADWSRHMLSLPWRYLTGGSWHKTGGLGVGYHVRGDSEPWYLLAKGKPTSRTALTNAWSTPRGRHSEKPVKWLAAAIENCTDPGDLVLSLWSGLCPEARAAKLTGRRLIGAELDPGRHAEAVGLLANLRVPP